MGSLEIIATYTKDNLSRHIQRCVQYFEVKNKDTDYSSAHEYQQAILQFLYIEITAYIR